MGEGHGVLAILAATVESALVGRRPHRERIGWHEGQARWGTSAGRAFEVRTTRSGGASRPDHGAGLHTDEGVGAVALQPTAHATGVARGAREAPATAASVGSDTLIAEQLVGTIASVDPAGGPTRVSHHARERLAPSAVVRATVAHERIHSLARPSAAAFTAAAAHRPLQGGATSAFVEALVQARERSLGTGELTTLAARIADGSVERAASTAGVRGHVVAHQGLRTVARPRAIAPARAAGHSLELRQPAAPVVDGGGVTARGQRGQSEQEGKTSSHGTLRTSRNPTSMGPATRVSVRRSAARSRSR